MPRDGGSQSTKKPASTPVKTGYLVLYNAVSSVAWSVVLARTVSTLLQHGPDRVYLATGQWLLWTQTMAAMEVLHSLFGIVRSPIITTVMQVASRFILVWGIVYPFPHLAFSPFYSSMLVAWSVTEVIRYSYFATSLTGLQPSLLTWLRYNTFFVLYPLGITSECALVYLATVPAGELGDVYKWALYALLATYVPGAYTLYTYMMSQRRKVLRAEKAKGEKSK